MPGEEVPGLAPAALVVAEVLLHVGHKQAVHTHTLLRAGQPLPTLRSGVDRHINTVWAELIVGECAQGAAVSGKGASMRPHETRRTAEASVPLTSLYSWKIQGLMSAPRPAMTAVQPLSVRRACAS